MLWKDKGWDFQHEETGWLLNEEPNATVIKYFRTICNAAESIKSFGLLDVKHFQNIHSYNKMLFRVCHASIMQACNKKTFWRNHIGGNASAFRNERVVYCRGVIKRISNTIIGTEEEWHSLSVMDFVVVVHRSVKQDFIWSKQFSGKQWPILDFSETIR